MQTDGHSNKEQNMKAAIVFADRKPEPVNTLDSLADLLGEQIAKLEALRSTTDEQE